MTTSLEVIDVTAEAFKSLVWDVMVKNLTVTILGFFSINPTGAIGILAGKIVIHYAEKLYPLIKKIIKVGTIKLANEMHQRAYEKASYKLRVVAIEKGIDSKEFKEERKREHEKQAALVIYNIQYS